MNSESRFPNNVKWSLKLASYFLFKFFLSKKIKNQKNTKTTRGIFAHLKVELPTFLTAFCRRRTFYVIRPPFCATALAGDGERPKH